METYGAGVEPGDLGPVIGDEVLLGILHFFVWIDQEVDRRVE